MVIDRDIADTNERAAKLEARMDAHEERHTREAQEAEKTLSGCQIQQTAGNFTLSNPVTGAPSTTSVTFTWSGTPIASDTYTFVYRCGP